MGRGPLRWAPPTPEGLAQAPPPPRLADSPVHAGPALRSRVKSREPGCGVPLRAVMAAPMYGSPGGRLARALTRALALALVLALLVGLFLSGLTGAIPISGRRWGPNGPVPPDSRSRSVLLDAETGQLRLVDGRHPEAVAWANLTNAIRETG